MNRLSVLLLLSVAMVCSVSGCANSWPRRGLDFLPRLVHSMDNGGSTALHQAAYRNNVDVAKQLLENSANVDGTDNNGNTALHIAAKKNSVDVARLLLAKSANVDSPNKFGDTALHWAAYYNSVGVATLLLAKSANVASTADDG